MKVVICGGGIIGVSVAYHLAEKGVQSTIIERCEPACAASGKAGGFLAKDWCDSYELGSLSNISYDMHMTLSKDERFKECDYRCLDTLGITVREGMEGIIRSSLPEWMNGSVVKSQLMGTHQSTAQVHPYKLTHTMLKMAKELVGTDIKIGVVEGVERNNTNKVTGIKIEGEVIPADVVVVALGPWSSLAMKWFDLAPITGQRAHSIIMKPTAPLSAHALFIEYGPKGKQGRSPEIYPRPDGTVYMCGMSDQEELPDVATQVKPNIDSCTILKDMSNHISDAFQDAEILAQQACFLPISPDGLPIIGAIPNTQGAFVATGHSCWGILNSLATGEAMAQLIVDGNCSLLDLAPFDPTRFM